MARTRGPGNLVARRSTTEARTDAAAHRDYAVMIDHDLGGRRATSYRAVDEGAPATTAELLLRPLSLFLFACTAFVIVLLLWLWQAGVFGSARLALTPPKPVESPAWMGARQAVPPALPEAADPLPGTAVTTTPPTAPNDGANSQDADAVDAQDSPAE